MGLPEIPLVLFPLTAIIFILIAAFTNIRYELRPTNYIGHSAIFASLVVGFIFLYSMQKFDRMDGNVPVVERNIVFLTEIALEYDPSTLCFLIEYLDNFLNFENNKFPILRFENAIAPKINDETVSFRVREAVTILELISHERITRTNLIPEEIWYTVYIIAFLLSVIFPLDSNFAKSLDSIIVIVLIWFPIITIYYLYQTELTRLQETIENTKDELIYITKKKGINCKKVILNE